MLDAAIGGVAIAPFNVLDRQQPVHRHALLEASAGTGKTFAIENVVVRLLIESHAGQAPLSLEQILVVTFTKASTRDLKQRIRANLEKALAIFRHYLNGEPAAGSCPDYLMGYLEQGETAVVQAKRLVEQALFSFDQAQIFTIHGFCWRMLSSYAMEGGISLESGCREEQPQIGGRLLQVVRDFLRTELVADAYSAAQLKIILRRAKQQIDKLQDDLLDVVNRGIEVLPGPSLAELVPKFQLAMQHLKQSHDFHSEKIVADFHTQVPAYKDLCNIKKQLHPEILHKVQRFAALFDKEQWQLSDLDGLITDGLYLIEALDPSQLKAKHMPLEAKSLHYPFFNQIVKEALGTILQQAGDEQALFARLASDCQKFVRRYQTEEELLGFTDLLLQMQQAIKHPVFAARVRKAYAAAIVDEFQDTDPMQWDIFATLFASVNTPWQGYLYLVGDPKQSIYAFRQADIYTYLAAQARLGDGALATLDTNFRSQPKLIEALNILFSAVDSLFPLPKIAGALPYRNVKAGKEGHKRLAGSDACLHFWLVQGEGKAKSSYKDYEESYFFPAMAKEILRLNTQDGLKFSQCAILVADRYQAERLGRFLKSCHIPVKNQKGDDLSVSPAVEAMREVLSGILHYRQSSPLKVALGGRIIGLTHADLVALNDEAGLTAIMRQCEHLRQILLQHGIGHFYLQLMQSTWHANKTTENVAAQTVAERLLRQTDGYEFYCQCQDVADLIIGEQAKRNCSPEAILAFLDELPMLAEQGDESIKTYLDADEEGVSVLTTHISKGLEFDVVFALGLINRKVSDKKLILIEEDDRQYLAAAIPNDAHHQRHCQEIDAEKMRQLYVALTRAKYRLYIPVVMAPSDTAVPFGSASPMDLFLARLNQPKADYAAIYGRLQGNDGFVLREFVNRNSAVMQLTVLTEDSATVPPLPAAQPPVLLPPPTVLMPSSTCVMQSFTSLAHAKGGFSFENAETLAVPHDFGVELKTEHTLPSSNETGVLLHRLLELLPLGSVKEMPNAGALLPWLRPLLQNTPFAAWEQVLAKLLCQSLQTELPGSTPPFCLADIAAKSMYRETEFLFACQKDTHFENVPLRPGFLKGVIDLFFEHQGKYYLLDWKSNWLGPTNAYYQTAHLEVAMRANQYDLQAKLYVEALRRYLAIFNIPFESAFGGVYYVFMRGIGPGTGIWQAKF